MSKVRKVEYKPILVFYVKDKKKIDDQIGSIKKYASDNGYDVLIWGEASTERLEIVSVDKETVITDLQKWIDKEIKKHNKK